MRSIKNISPDEFVGEKTKSLFDTYDILKGVSEDLIENLVRTMTETYLQLDTKPDGESLSEAERRLEKEGLVHPIIIQGLEASVFSSLQCTYGS
jgi:hypothetical protein